MLFNNETMPFKQGVRSSNLRWSTKKKPVSSMLTGFSALLQVYATIHIFTRKTERFFKLNGCFQAIFQAKLIRPLPLVLGAEIEGDHHEGDIVHGIGIYCAGDGKIRPHGKYDDGHNGLDLDKICNVFNHNFLLIHLRWAAPPAAS